MTMWKLANKIFLVSGVGKMIKRINALKGIGCFPSLHQTNGSENDFSKLNVIYAKNGCGKSTLCDVFRSLDTGNPAYVIGRKSFASDFQPEVVFLLEGKQTLRFQNDQWHDRNHCPPIYVYDDRFVADNVLIGLHVSPEQRRNLYGLVIGNQAITMRQAVDTAEQQLNTASTAFNTARDNLTRLIPANTDIDLFRNIVFIDDVDNKIAIVADELKLAEQTKTKADAIRTRRPLAALPIAEVPEILDSVLSSTLNTAALAAEVRIKNHLVAKSQSQGLPISWVKQGFESQTATACPYCGQDMKGLEILEAYRFFFSGELQEQERLRESAKSFVKVSFGDNAQNELRRILTANETEQDWWKDAAGYEFRFSEIGEIESILALLESTYQGIKSALERKQANPGSAIHFTDKESEAITSWREKVSKLRAYNETLLVINDELKKLQKSAGVLNLEPLQQKISCLITSKSRYEQKVVDAYTVYDTAVYEKNMAKQNKQQANETLRIHSNQQFEWYGEKINYLLKQFGADFHIVNDGVTFRGGPSGQLAIELRGERVSAAPEAASNPSQPSLANTLSGGDRSALALAYFLALVEISADVNKAIVVFDDPYHNQDRSRRQCTIERIHHLTEIANQCFVFSHDLEFARSVTKLFGTPARTFLLQINSTTFKATPLPLLPSQAYLTNYNRLDSYFENPDNHLLHLKEVADTVRVILEEYLRLKFPKAWADNDWLGDMIRKIREAEKGTPLVHCQSIAEELGHINTYSQRFHHGSSGETADDPDPRELKTYVHRTLAVIHA